MRSARAFPSGHLRGDVSAAAGDSGSGRTERALERLESARRDRGIEDPRPVYRRLLKRLSGEDRDAYREAVRRFQEELVPAVAAGESDPVSAWLRYGLRLAAALGDGEVRAVDESGRAASVDDPADPPVGPLLLWLPEDGGQRATVLSRPEEPSDPQRATLDLLT